MHRQIRFLPLILAGLGCLGWAQTPVAPALAGNTENVTIGQSAARLYGPWKFTVGDSPIDPATHQPLWAEPGFDDSKWENVDLTPKEGATDPVIGFTEYVPGWTAKGHPGYWGYAWYRIRVYVHAQPDQRFSLAGPADVDDGYEVFANNVRLGSFGDFSQSRPIVYTTQPTIYQLPEQVTNGSGYIVFAFRMWMEPSTVTQEPDVGGFHNAPLLGDPRTVTAEDQIRWLELTRAYVFYPIDAFFFLLIALVAFCIFIFDRSDRVYLWMGAVLLFAAANQAFSAISIWTQLVGAVTFNLIGDAIMPPLIYFGWVMVWWVWFRLRRPSWLPGAAFALTIPLILSIAISENLWFTLVPDQVVTAFHVASIIFRLLFMSLILGIVIQGIRKYGIEGWLALPAVLLYGISRFAYEFSVSHLVPIWFPFGVQISMGQLAGLLLIAVIALLLMRRLLYSLEQQRRLALDVKQAHEVQQVILPPARMTLPGLEIESEYRPAMEVGGDFFQIIPHPTDGSVLIVAGDVAGKGLRAGMLVALLVGAVRSTVDWSADPEVVLKALNLRLCGRSDAQATCLVLRINADGAVLLVNAGHLPPYLNGAPLAMEGALPLGMMPGALFTSMHFKLALNDRLVLLSDGIAEATDGDGHLFGFDRVEQLLQAQPSAAEIAAAAQRFGQQDDISVISVTRMEARA
ncbi:MAG: PP2C family protein-serine/threonine phosphatase [Terracidiphilus sp.]